MKIRCIAGGANHLFTTSRRSAVYLCESFIRSSFNSCHVTMTYIDPKMIEWYCIWYKQNGKVSFIGNLPDYVRNFSSEVQNLHFLHQDV